MTDLNDKLNLSTIDFEAFAHWATLLRCNPTGPNSTICHSKVEAPFFWPMTDIFIEWVPLSM